MYAYLIGSITLHAREKRLFSVWGWENIVRLQSLSIVNFLPGEKWVSKRASGHASAHTHVALTYANLVWRFVTEYKLQYLFFCPLRCSLKIVSSSSSLLSNCLRLFDCRWRKRKTTANTKLNFRSGRSMHFDAVTGGMGAQMHTNTHMDADTYHAHRQWQQQGTKAIYW